MKEFQHIDWRSLKRFRQTITNKETGRPFQQQELAKKAGISQPYLARIERGDMISPGRNYVEGIATALGMKVEHMLPYLEKRDKETNFANSVNITYTNEPRKIPLFGKSYRPKGFKYSDGILLEKDAEIPCPPNLDKDISAYALELPTNTMQPRYHAGDILYVTADKGYEPRAGDDVVLMFEHDDRQIAIVREVVFDGQYYEEGYVDDGYAEDEQAQIYVMPLNQKMRYMRSSPATASVRPMGIDIPPDGKIAEYFVDDLAAMAGSDADGPFPTDGSSGVHVHIVVGSWRGRKQRKNVAIQVEGIKAKVEMGEVTMTVNRADKI